MSDPGLAARLAHLCKCYHLSVLNEISSARCHDHLSLIHQDDAERLAAMVPFFKHGLARNERCIYIGDTPPVGKEFDALVRDGLIVLGTSDAYLRDGRFDLERMLATFRVKAAEARQERFSALRVAGEAAWILSGAPGADRFFEYESRVNELFSELEVVALCLYDRRLFSPEHLHAVLRTHPLIIHREKVCRNFHYEPPEEFLSPGRASREIDRRLDAIRAAQLQAAKTPLPEQSLQAQRLEAVGRLAGGIAHEFNNILTSVLGLSKIIEENLPAGSASRDDIRQISDLGRKAAALTNQLLAFAQRRHSWPRRLELASAVQAVVRDLAPALGKDVRLAVAKSERPLFVRVDPEALEQILVHLCVNAREAMPNGGTLDIGTRAVTLSRPDAETRDYALLSVTDTGVGMSPEAQAHIFDPFFSTKEAAPSAGLSLSAVYGLVRQNGGFIEVFSAPDRGATFRIHFPLLAPDPA